MRLPISPPGLKREFTKVLRESRDCQRFLKMPIAVGYLIFFNPSDIGKDRLLTSVALDGEMSGRENAVFRPQRTPGEGAQLYDYDC
ncbi:MAG: hypothetical protein IT288_02570 [Bdellovibrionales bacterium]|nr:hypothetical protein [Bdellovibrionales bacterium]